MRMWQVRACLRVILGDPGSELVRFLTGSGISPGATLVAIYDAIAGGNWQRAGSKGPRPKPMMAMIEEAARRDKAQRLRSDAANGGDTAAKLAYLSQFDPAVQSQESTR